MTKILIVTRCFYPHGDATSGVVGNLAKALKQQGCDVSILALASYKEDEKHNSWYGIDVKNIYVAESRLKEQIKKELKEKPIRTTLITAKKSIIKLYGKINPKYKRLSINPVLSISYRKYLKSVLNENHYDLCLITMMPHEAVWAMMSLIKQNSVKTPFGVLQYDTFWNQEEIPVKYKEDRFRFEQDIANQSLFVMTTRQIYSANTERDASLKGKLISSEFPSVVEKLSEEKTLSDGKTHCVFLGRLYEKIRPPEKVVKVIAGLDLSDIVFDFYGMGQELIENSPDYLEAKSRIVLHGSVGNEEAEKVRALSDVLVNIDNANLSQVPSKIFEYISSCKPILNFYFDDNSPILDYLYRYPNCLNVNVNKQLDYNLIKDFIIKSKLTKLDFSTIQDIFSKNTPDYVAQQCLNAFKNATRETQTLKF